jgi:hypothetical protein
VKAPTRTIASVSDLPEPKRDRQLGSAESRNDVGSGRATMLVDTMEKAARRVAATMTPDKVEFLKVDKDKLFTDDFKSKTKNPQYMVASFASKPMQIADVGDLNLGFPNPFANVKTKTVEAPAGEPEKLKTTRTARSVGENLRDTNERGEPEKLKTTRTAATNSVNPTPQSPFANTAKTSNNADANDRKPSSQSRNFKQMDRSSLMKFIAGSVRDVSSHLTNVDFAQALIQNKIQIRDHEGQKIGSIEPDITYFYDENLGRFRPNRSARVKK